MLFCIDGVFENVGFMGKNLNSTERTHEFRFRLILPDRREKMFYVLNK